MKLSISGAEIERGLDEGWDRDRYLEVSNRVDGRGGKMPDGKRAMAFNALRSKVYAETGDLIGAHPLVRVNHNRVNKTLASLARYHYGSDWEAIPAEVKDRVQAWSTKTIATPGRAVR